MGPQRFFCIVVLKNFQLSGKDSSFLHYSRAEQTNKVTNVLHQAGYWEESSLEQTGESAGVLTQSGPCKVPLPKRIKMRCSNTQVGQQNGKNNAETSCWLFFGSCLKDQRQGFLAARREDTQRIGTKTERCQRATDLA